MAKDGAFRRKTPRGSAGHDMQAGMKPDQWTKPVQTGKADFFRMRRAENKGSLAEMGEDSLN